MENGRKCWQVSLSKNIFKIGRIFDNKLAVDYLILWFSAITVEKFISSDLPTFSENLVTWKWKSDPEAVKSLYLFLPSGNKMKMSFPPASADFNYNFLLVEISRTSVKF